MVAVCMSEREIGADECEAESLVREPMGYGEERIDLERKGWCYDCSVEDKKVLDEIPR